MKAYPTVSIIIPTYNGGSEPFECVKSINKLNYPKDKIKIIVVNNNFRDNTPLKLQNIYSNTKVYTMKENVGFAGAVNFGIKKSKSDYLFIGNDDLVFEKTSLKNMVNYLITHPKVAVVGGKILLKSKKNKIVSAGYRMNVWTGNIYPAESPSIAKTPDWVQGCAMLIPKKVFQKIGVFDIGYKLVYFEDYDFCLRAKRQNFGVRFLPQAIFYHGESTTINKNTEAKYFQWYKNKIRFILKNFPVLNIISIILLQTFVVMPIRLIVLRDGRFIAYYKGVLWNIRHFTKTIHERALSFL